MQELFLFFCTLSISCVDRTKLSFCVDKREKLSCHFTTLTAEFV